MVAPFISHWEAVPSSLRNRMSERPSPLKSPIPATCQLTPGLPRLVLESSVAPFICHSAVVPSSLRNRMSERPSLLKSPIPATFQLAPGLPRLVLESSVPPFICYSEIVPSSLRHRMSERPSPLKSRPPMALLASLGRSDTLPFATCQLIPGLPRLVLESSVAPFICHSAIVPSSLRNRMSE